MSIEKLDFTKVTREQIPYTIISTKVIQNIEDITAGYIWIYLSSLPPGWEVNKEHLKKKFKIGYNKLERVLAYLKRVNLIEYVRSRCANGKLAQVTINVLCGDRFIQENQQLEKCATTPMETMPVENHSHGSGVHIKEINNKENINKKTISKRYYANELAHDTPTEDLFEQFWNEYPRKKDKSRARDIWRRKRYDEIATLILADIANRLSNDAQWQDDKFIPHPSTYLRNERWHDDVTQDKPKLQNQFKGKRYAYDVWEDKQKDLNGRIYEHEGNRLSHGEEINDF